MSRILTALRLVVSNVVMDLKITKTVLRIHQLQKEARNAVL